MNMSVTRSFVFLSPHSPYRRACDLARDVFTNANVDAAQRKDASVALKAAERGKGLAGLLADSNACPVVDPLEEEIRCAGPEAAAFLGAAAAALAAVHWAKQVHEKK